MMREPVEERLSQHIDAMNAGLPQDAGDAELQQLAADAARAKEALTLPTMPEPMEERVWQRVRTAMYAPREAAERREKHIGARIWACAPRWAVAVGLAVVAVGAFAGVYVPRLAKHKLDAAQVPAVRFVRPGNGQIVSGEVLVEIARGGGAVPQRIELQLDGQVLAEIEELPGKVRWNARQVSPGPHVLSAVAYGANGRVWATSVAVTVINKAALLGGVKGLVLRPDGTPAAGVKVRVAGPRTLVLGTAADGSFRADRLPAGGYAVLAEADGHEPALTQVQVHAGEQCRVALRLEARAAGDAGAQRAVPPPARVRTRVMFPFDGALMHGVVPVVLELDPAHKGVGRVDVEVDGRRVFGADRPPYEWTWDTGEVEDGQHDVTFRVRCSECGEHVFRARVTVANEPGSLGVPGGGVEGEEPKPPGRWVNAPPNPR